MIMMKGAWDWNELPCSAVACSCSHYIDDPCTAHPQPYQRLLVSFTLLRSDGKCCITPNPIMFSLSRGDLLGLSRSVMTTLAAGGIGEKGSQNLCPMTSSSKLNEQDFFRSQLKSLLGQLLV